MASTGMVGDGGFEVGGETWGVGGGFVGGRRVILER